jgi:hypothetical protein
MINCKLRDQDSYCCLPPGPQKKSKWRMSETETEWMTDEERRHDPEINPCCNKPDQQEKKQT